MQGTDAAHKLAILIQHAFGEPIVTQHIPHSGIDEVGTGAVRRARQHGYELKLLAFARRGAQGISAQVGPVLVPFTHPFSKVDGVENVVRVVGASAGPLLFSGAGAGREAAASAVLGDVVAALRAIAERHGARRLSAGAHGTQAVAPAFERFPAFAGYPVLTTPTKGDTHVGYSSRTLSAV